MTDGSVDEVQAKTEAVRRLRLGVGAFLATVLVLSLASSLPSSDAVGFGVFYVFLPALGWAQLPLLPVTAIERASVYAGSAATLALIGAAALVFGFARGGANTFPFLWGLPLRTVAVLTVGLVVFGLGVILAFEPMHRWKPSRGAALVFELLPRTAKEKWAFVGLSVVAGIAEEVAYRGYALSAFELLMRSPLLGVPSAWLAAAASSIPFAVLHAYQGPVGVARTALVGFALASSVVVSGNILPAILAHALIDILAGLVVGPWLLERSEMEHQPT